MRNEYQSFFGVISLTNTHVHLWRIRHRVKPEFTPPPPPPRFEGQEQQTGDHVHAYIHTYKLALNVYGTISKPGYTTDNIKSGLTLGSKYNLYVLKHSVLNVLLLFQLQYISLNFLFFEIVVAVCTYLKKNKAKEKYEQTR